MQKYRQFQPSSSACSNEEESKSIFDVFIPNLDSEPESSNNYEYPSVIKQKQAKSKK